MRGQSKVLVARCKCPLTELRLQVALPLLPCISFPIFEACVKGWSPSIGWVWNLKEVEMQRKAVVQLLTWCYGILILANVANHHERLDTHCLLDVSRNLLMDFRKLWEFLIHAER